MSTATATPTTTEGDQNVLLDRIGWAPYRTASVAVVNVDLDLMT